MCVLYSSGVELPQTYKNSIIHKRNTAKAAFLWERWSDFERHSKVLDFLFFPSRLSRRTPFRLSHVLTLSSRCHQIYAKTTLHRRRMGERRKDSLLFPTWSWIFNFLFLHSRCFSSWNCSTRFRASVNLSLNCKSFAQLTSRKRWKAPECERHLVAEWRCPWNPAGAQRRGSTIFHRHELQFPRVSSRARYQPEIISGKA